MLSTLVCLVTTAWAWPAASDWVPLTQSGMPLADPVGDHGLDQHDALDLVGVSGASALQWSADADDVWFRLVLADDPRSGSLYVPGTWGVLLDVDSDASTFEYLIAATGVTAQLEAWENQEGTPGLNVPFEDYRFLDLLDPVDSVRRTESGGLYTLDLRISRITLDGLLGIGDIDGMRMVAFTGSSVFSPRIDVAACDGRLGACVLVSSVASGSVFIDQDQDRLTDPQEQVRGSEIDDADSDDDGRLDGEEPDGNSDGDLLPDVWDCDADNDGILDGTEVGLVMGDLHPDTDLSADCFVSDQDPVASPTDPSHWDTDGGSLSDGIEDWNYNGRVDDPWETDPNNPLDDVDSDGDTIADVLELQGADGSVNDVDSDGDGISDAVEWLYDTDQDGIPNFLDVDSDNDGIEDAIEGAIDTDGDGVPDYLDEDSDNDGLLDVDEGSGNHDDDALEDFRDLDSDNDGIDDAVEGLDDADGDGLGNSIDDDSDGDGISDEDEGAIDTDGDGIDDFLDEDSDDDGIPDEVETGADQDGDGDPNHVDEDSDNDDIPDREEGIGDADCDGMPDYLDAHFDDGLCNPSGNPFVDGDFTGGACSVNPLGVAWLPIGLVIAFFRRRRAVAGAALLVSSAAGAQDGGIDAQRFAPSVDGRAFVGVEDTSLAEAWSYGGTLWFNHADDPFVFRPEDPSLAETRVLGAVSTANVVGFFSFGPAVVGIDVPVHLRTTGFDTPVATYAGDLTLSAKGRFYEGEIGSLEAGVGGYLGLSLPTGATRAWVGSGSAGVRGAALGSVRWNNWVASANLGLRSGSGREVGEIVATPAFEWATGVGYEVRSDTWVSAELDGERWIGNGGQAVAPTEWLLSVRHNPVSDLLFTVGGGSGLSRGVGAPDFRLVAGVGFTPGARRASEDVSVDAVVQTDPDPVAGDVIIRAVGPSGVPVKGAEVRLLGTDAGPRHTGPNGVLEVKLYPGEHEIAVAAPGWVPTTQRFEVPDGGHVDFMVFMMPEEVFVDTDNQQIFLHRKVFFELDRAELKLESLGVLDALVETLKSHPEIELLRVEGHTDITGTEAHNLELSRERAAAVRNYLVREGIGPERLQVKGLGESRVLQQGESDVVHATNRRVEFHLVRLADAE